MPRRGGKAGVEILARHGGVDHRDRIGPQVMVQGVAHLAGFKFLHQVEMRHLAQGMDAGIGAARAGDRDALAGEFFDGRFQRGLHRGAFGLALPADERAAVILDGQAVAHQAMLPALSWPASRGPSRDARAFFQEKRLPPWMAGPPDRATRDRRMAGP